MNQYSFKVADDFSTNSVPETKQIVRGLGYAALMAAEFHVFNDSAGAGAIKVQMVRVTTPMRVPSSLGYSADGTLIGGASVATQTMVDNQRTAELQNQERAIVNQGDFIVAMVPTGSDVSAEMVFQRSFNVNGGSIVFGTASQTAQQGVYATPFSSAKAFVNFGTLQVERGVAGNAPVVVVPETAPVAVTNINPDNLPTAPTNRF
jgi:precorrin-6B methylase 2